MVQVREERGAWEDSRQRTKRKLNGEGLTTSLMHSEGFQQKRFLEDRIEQAWTRGRGLCKGELKLCSLCPRGAMGRGCPKWHL